MCAALGIKGTCSHLSLSEGFMKPGKCAGTGPSAFLFDFAANATCTSCGSVRHRRGGRQCGEGEQQQARVARGRECRQRLQAAVLHRGPAEQRREHTAPGLQDVEYGERRAELRLWHEPRQQALQRQARQQAGCELERHADQRVRPNVGERHLEHGGGGCEAETRSKGGRLISANLG